MATIPNISFEEGKGSDFTIECNVTDAENIEGFEAHFRMAEDDSPTSNTLISKNTTDEGDAVTIVENNVFITFDSDETDYSSGVSSGEYYIEVTLEDGDGNMKLAGKGILTLLETNIKIGE